MYDSLNLAEVWRSYELGGGVGGAGMLSADIDNDGWKEIVVSSDSGSSISVLRFDENYSYNILRELNIGKGFLVFALNYSIFPVYKIGAVNRIVQLTGSLNSSIAIGQQFGNWNDYPKHYRLLIYDLSENLIKNVFQVSREIVDILVADVDGNGMDEILVFDENDLSIFEYSDQTGDIEFIKTFSIQPDVSIPRKGFVTFGSFTEM